MSEPIPAPSEGQPGEGKGDSCLIEHSEAVVDDWGALLATPDFSDVIFVVEGERIHAHKTVLSARCEYFKAMLFGGLKESSEAEAKLEGTSCLPFRTLLKYIYTGKVELSAFKVEELLAILQLAHEYRLLKIQAPIVDFLKNKLDITSAMLILRSSVLLSDELTECCMQVADQHTSEMLTSQDFLTLNQKAVMEVLSRYSFYTPEIDIFKAVCDWVRAQPTAKGATKEGLVESFISKKCLRLDLIGTEELLSTVRHSELFETNSVALHLILDAVERRNKGTASDIRQPAVVDENVATAELGAVIVEGENKETLLSGAQESCDSISLTRHRIGQPEGIVVQLGRPYTINSVKLNIGNSGEDTTYDCKLQWLANEKADILSIPDNPTIKYLGSAYCPTTVVVLIKLMVSMHRLDWQTVASYRGCQCYPIREAIFNARLVRYIRVLGSWSNNEYFSLVSFKALFSTMRARSKSPKVCKWTE